MLDILAAYGVLGWAALRRHWYGVTVLLLLALFGLTVLAARVPVQAPTPTPAVSATPAPAARLAEPTAEPTSVPYHTWYERQHQRVVSPAALEVSLRQRGWPNGEASRIVEAVVTCESAAYDDAGRTIGIDLWIHTADGGETVGPGIHLPSHPGIETRHDLSTLGGAADAMTEIRDEAIRIGWRPLQPWTCVR